MKPEQPNNRKITIAGAGLAGSLLGVMLGQRGYQVTILERRSDTRGVESDSGRSINLALSSRGIHALKIAGLFEKVEKLLIPMKGRMLHFQDGNEEFSPYGQRESEVIYSVSRRDLNHLMIDAAVEAPLVEVKFDQQLDAVDFKNNRLGILDLKSNQTRKEEFELLIGADGAGSRTRRSLIKEVGGKSESDFLDHDYKELEITAGQTASGSDYQIEPNALHIWPRGGFMLIALPNQDHSFTVTLFMPKTGENSFEQLSERDALVDFFKTAFPSAFKLIDNLESDFFGNPQGRLGTVRCEPWFYKDKVLILGDAAHAIVPFHGQGMNEGFEDCSELIRLLDEHDEDWAKVIPKFDEIRRPNCHAIAEMALENYVTMRSSVADPKFQLKKELGFKLEKRFPSRFVPRYSMVMFRLIPYAEARQRGKIQQEILGELVEGVESIDDVDFAKAEKMILQRLVALD